MTELSYNSVSSITLAELQELLGEDAVTVDQEQLEKYGQDETEDLCYYPEVVVKPMNVEQVSDLMKYCNQHKLPVTTRGAGTGLSGGALPIKGGVLLSMEKSIRAFQKTAQR